ncbi:MAG: TonB-dependent receptor [Gammaproteobacteria bacterium]|nr:TonB-dependent receptor [Gammaproteobacteria bacterium]
MSPCLRTLIGLSVIFLASTIPAHADTEQSPIVVTASRVAQTADETLSFVTVITREEIERSGAHDIADILRFHAGLDIGRNGGPGQQTSLFLRGTDSNHTLILLDGVRINPGTIGGAPLQIINPEMIDRIEIVRGPNSTLYGSDAIGGVIQIFTRRAEKDHAVSATLGHGADSAKEAGVSLSHSSGIYSFGIDANYQETDGFPARTASGIDRGHDNASANAHIGINTATADIELSHWQARGTTEYLDFFLTPVSQDFTNSVSAVTLRSTSTGNWVPTLKLSRMEDDIQQQESPDFVRTRRNILDWQNDFSFEGNHLLTAGLYLLREKTDSLSFGSGFSEDTDVNAVFFQDQIDLADHQLRVSTRYTDHENSGSKTTWGIAYGYKFSSELRLFANAGTAFRAPDATDRFGFGGNPALSPETSRNLELGLQKNWGQQQKLRLALFDNTIDDLIVFSDPDGFLGPEPGMNENIEKAGIRGLELGYSLSMGKYSGSIDATWQDPENESTGKQLARRAKRTITTRIDYDAGRYQAGLEFIATGKRRDSDFSNTVMGGYGLLNLHLQAPVGKHFSIDGKLENALDKQYELADGFAVQDRAVFITLRYQD